MNKKVKMGRGKQNEGGYVGLLTLLLGVAILAILFVRSYATPTVNPVVDDLLLPTGSSGTSTAVPQTETARAKMELDRAREAGDAINAHNRATNALLGE